MSTNVRNFRKAVFAMDAVVRRVPEWAWDSRSPCEGWTAAQVVGHAACVFDAVIEMADSGMMVVPAQPAAVMEPRAVWTTARDRLLVFLDEPHVLDREGVYWFGFMSIDDLLSFVQWDPLTHAWDVAAATGVPCVLDDDLTRISFEKIRSIAEGLREANEISAAVKIAGDAPLLDRYLALTGRDPAAGLGPTVSIRSQG